ncbi:hypothetical protein FOZ61_003218 [Perkinsus olseni]|uniref:Methyltransferase type 11 domain-containing protein n=1 Tax=Perkinsus olseni TaxID=32597 RepID=A0A7J6MIH3_PEROL|nr:hypothetical protein FOZ61_003218 [Perkinsus olseni]KAF4673946.1 hypothetical protein FOL46_006139 [Perkinsus olseni]
MSPPMPHTGYDGLNETSDAQQWGDIHEDFNGERLDIDGHPVMQKWEAPYMHALAELATSKGGRVLELGFGLGLSASAVQKHDIDEHIIIEANKDVFKRLQAFASRAPHKVTPMLGFACDVVATLPDNSIDGILYDTYPHDKDEQHTHQFKFIKEAYRVLKPGGILTYCNLTSIGVLKGEYDTWQELWEKTQLPHVRSCGFDDAGIKPFRIFPVTPAQDCEYYEHNEALIPVLYK